MKKRRIMIVTIRDVNLHPIASLVFDQTDSLRDYSWQGMLRGLAPYQGVAVADIVHRIDIEFREGDDGS